MIVRVETTVRQATIYRNGALLVREGLLPADRATEAVTLVLPGLPLLFNAASLRLRFGTAGLFAGPLEELPELEATATVPASAKEERDRLRQEMRRLEQELEVWQRLQKMANDLEIQGLPADLTQRPTALPSVESWAAHLTLQTERSAHCAEEVRQRRARIHDINQRLMALSATQRTPRPGRYTRTLRAALEREDPFQGGSAVPVFVEYFIAGARWAPVYQVHIDTEQRSARLRFGARVAQATGEDWSGVAISVSTADLRRDAAIPRLDAWRIGRSTPPRSDWRPLPDDLDTLFSDYDATAAPPKPPRPKPSQRQKPPSVQSTPPAPSLPTDNMPPPQAATPMPSATPTSAPTSAPRRLIDRLQGGLEDGRSGAPAPKRASHRRRTRTVGHRAPTQPMADEASFGEMLDDMERSQQDGPPAGRMLDYAWLRLADATEPHRRGRLLPVDLMSEYRAFIDERDGDVTTFEGLRAALQALQQEQQRLHDAHLPTGCADVRRASFYHRYPAGPRADLPADGQFRLIQVADGDTACTLLIRAVPRQDRRAFRFARMGNPFGWPLLAGPMQVYLDGQFVVTSRMPTTGAQGELSLNLGVEERVRISRNTTFRQSEHGMFAAASRLDHRVQVAVRSNLPAPVAVELFERLPDASGEEGVELDLLDAEPPPIQGRAPGGGMTHGALCWQLTLPGGSQTEISYRYSIDISARKELIGGNRREP